MKINRKMEIITFIIGLTTGVFLMTVVGLLLCHEQDKPQEPVMTLLNYEDGRTTHIATYEYPPPDKYIIYTTHGVYRVPENFMIYHAAGEKFLYMEDVETGEKQYPYPVRCYENEVRDFSHEQHR